MNLHSVLRRCSRIYGGCRLIDSLINRGRSDAFDQQRHALGLDLHICSSLVGSALVICAKFEDSV